jgi:hypothetical protein
MVFCLPLQPEVPEGYLCNHHCMNIKSSKDRVAASSDFSAPLAVSAQRKNPAIIEGTAGTQPMHWLQLLKTQWKLWLMRVV